MVTRCLTILAILIFGGMAYAQDKAKEPKWDVNAPALPLKKVSFKLSEGTWIHVDAHPTTGQLVFDLLGEIWALPPEGGQAKLLRGGLAWEFQPRWSPDGQHIAFTSDAGGGDNLWVMDADGGNARAVTKETFRLLCNPSWSPDGKFLVGRKHFTSGRSLGAGEMWLYPLSGGPGIGLTKKRNDQMDSNEPVWSPNGELLYWSEDSTPGRTFDYNKDPNGQIYVIKQKNLKTGEIETAVSGNGGAVRPQPSPDGKHLAFVRRVANKSVLHIKDLQTGDIRPVWDGLTKDQQETWAIHGVYPGYSWAPDGSIVIWAKGKLHRVNVETGTTKVIPFVANVEMEVAETLRHPMPHDPDGEVRTLVCRWPSYSAPLNELAWSAVGKIWRRPLDGDQATQVSPEGVFAYTPHHSPLDGTIVYTTWSDQETGRIRMSARQDQKTRGDRDRDLVTEPGHYLWPRFSPNGQWVVYQRLSGDGLRGRAHSMRAGIYRVSASGGKPKRISKSGSRPRWADNGQRVVFEERGGEDLTFVSVDFDGNDRRVLARGKDTTEFALSPDGRWLAFTDLWNAYICPFPSLGQELRVSRDMKNVPCVRLSRDAGQDLAFSPDSSRIWHGLGKNLWIHNVAALFEAPYGTKAKPSEPKEGEKPVAETHPQDLAKNYDLSQVLEADRPDGSILLFGGRIVTMTDTEDHVIENGGVLIINDRIHAIYAESEWKRKLKEQEEGLKSIDLKGRTVIPGLIDAHAHIRHGSSGMLPQRNWQHLANLSFGVTTTHDPSNDTRLTFTTAELQRIGEIVAPRLYSTGTILYGAGGNFRAPVEKLEDATSHIRRTQAFGATTVKSYNQPRRDQRQKVLKAARDLKVMVVPEGGSTLQHNLTHLVDGHTTLEHALPVAPFYDDVKQLFTHCGTAYTPTLIVGYGGIWGENYWYAKDEVWKSERLTRWMPRAMLDARSRRRTVAPEEEYNHIALAKGAAEAAKAGALVQVGAHGQIQGLGVHWEMRMFAQGGMSPVDCLRTATIWPARALGLSDRVGSLEPGKLADLLIIDGNPLARIEDAEKITHVMLGGRLRDARTLDQVHPLSIPLPSGPRVDLGAALGLGVGPTCPCGVHRP